MEKEKILIIDDDLSMRNLCQDILESKGYNTEQASSGEEGVELFRCRKFDLVLLDLQMSGMNGHDVLEAIREKDGDVPVIIMTGTGTIENAVNSMRKGAADFIVKPFDLRDFLESIGKNVKIGALAREVSRLKMVENILELNQTIIALTGPDILVERVVKILFGIFGPLRSAVYILDDNRKSFILRKQVSREGEEGFQKVSYAAEEVSDFLCMGKPFVDTGGSEIFVPLVSRDKRLEGFIVIEFKDNTRVSDEVMKFLETFAMQVSIGIENACLFQAVKQSHFNTIRSFINTLEARDPCTRGHSEQVAHYAFLIGKELGLDEEKQNVLRNASFLHDLGKVGIKDSILLKEGALNEQEQDIIREHPRITAKILEPLGMNSGEVEACFYHHEKIDGSGYPEGLCGDSIPLLARILSVADAYSAMISQRPYRDAMGHMEAMSELKKGSGAQFDKNIVDSFEKVLQELQADDLNISAT